MHAVATGDREPALLAPADAEALAIALKAVVRSMSLAADRRLARFDLTEAQSALLRSIANEGCRTMGEIVRLSGCDSGSTTRAIDRLEAKGMLTRGRARDDRRVVELCLTERGLTAASHVAGIAEKIMAEYLSGFSAVEAGTLETLLVRMRANGTMDRQLASEGQSARFGISA